MRRYLSVVLGAITLLVCAPASSDETSTSTRVYHNQLVRIENPQPLLADHPEFFEPIIEQAHFEAPPVVVDEGADLHVRAWRFSYNARGIIEVPNQARAGTLSQSQLQGGTFTITNLGMFDFDCFTPIINLPQSAILGVGRIVREPVVVGDSVVPGYRLGLSLTFDHRIIDGGPAARWLQGLGQMIQNPEQYRSAAG